MCPVGRRRLVRFEALPTHAIFLGREAPCSCLTVTPLVEHQDTKSVSPSLSPPHTEPPTPCLSLACVSPRKGLPKHAMLVPT
jgi:hypothetical protein